MTAFLLLGGGLLAMGLLAAFVLERLCERRDARRFPPPGRIVAASGREIHLLCQGEGPGPTIVIEQGAGSPSIFWWPVQRALAKSTRICTYDRPGYLWSPREGHGRSISARVDDLHALLVDSKLPGPFVMVAHSYGGLLVCQLARRYPELVAGIVFIDALDERGVFGGRYLEHSRRLRRIVGIMAFAARFGVLRLFNPMFAELPPQFDAEDLRTMKALGAHASLPSAMVDDFESMDHASAEEKQSAAPGSLGSIPVSVISHGIRFPPPYDVMEEGWDESQARLAALSSNSELVIAERSSHMIQLEQPELVIDAIARVHAAARDGTRLARSALRAT